MQPSDAKHILVALAWPYANGSLHLGHVASFLGADVLARYHRLRGDKVRFVSGSDCFGTPIAVEAAVQGVGPASIAETYHKEFATTLIDTLSFSYDCYSTTMHPEHIALVQDVFLSLYKKGFIYKKTDIVLFSPTLNRFLPDRFVEGTCPHCGYTAARGDQCDECGRLLETRALKNPRANPKIFSDERLRDEQLEERESEHFYLKLTAFHDTLETLVTTTGGSWRPQAARFTKGFLKQGLQDRAISRDIDWGISVPLKGYEEKKIYVWFEAVLGYLSASKQCSEGDEWRRWWCEKHAQHYYVHGKDNILFHTIILPAILAGYGDDLHLPDTVISSEYLLLEGEQFSTSRSHAVWAHECCQAFDAELIRYFLLAQGPETADMNFQWTTFGELVNGELIGTFGNLVNRICSFTKRQFPDGVSMQKEVSAPAKELLDHAARTRDKVGSAIEQGAFRHALRTIFALAEAGNRFAQTAEPWKIVKKEREVAAHDLATLLHVIHTLSIVIQPFLPKTSATIQTFFTDEVLKSESKDATGGVWKTPSPTAFVVRSVTPLFEKVEEEDIEKQRVLLGGK